MTSLVYVGKTSLTAALFRLVELQSGFLEIDGTDVRSVDLFELRKVLEIVTEDSILFSVRLQLFHVVVNVLHRNILIIKRAQFVIIWTHWAKSRTIDCGKRWINAALKKRRVMQKKTTKITNNCRFTIQLCITL